MAVLTQQVQTIGYARRRRDCRPRRPLALFRKPSNRTKKNNARLDHPARHQTISASTACRPDPDLADPSEPQKGHRRADAIVGQSDRLINCCISQPVGQQICPFGAAFAESIPPPIHHAQTNDFGSLKGVGNRRDRPHNRQYVLPRDRSVPSASEGKSTGKNFLFLSERTHHKVQIGTILPTNCLLISCGGDR